MKYRQKIEAKGVLNKLFLNDDYIFILILVNSITIFFDGFITDYSLKFKIDVTDSIITVLFLVEAIVKIRYHGWSKYISSNWNKFDFLLVVISLPSVYLLFSHFHTANLQFILIFRILRISRVLRFFRFFKFLPGIDNLFKGITRALRTSVFILIALGVYNFVLAILSCHLFGDIAPSMFGDPLKSFYTTFKVFTVEGWYEIPEKVVKNMNSPGLYTIGIKLYFIFLLITGGILGLSLINSILVDSMVEDNNNEIETKIDLLNRKIDVLIEAYNIPDKLKEELNNIKDKQIDFTHHRNNNT